MAAGRNSVRHRVKGSQPIAAMIWDVVERKVKAERRKRA
jgi:hypothetical protein